LDDLGFGHDRDRLLRARGLGGLGRLRRFGRLRGLLGLDFATQAVGVGPASDPVGLGVFNRRRGARSTYAKFLGERE
jgi:hypothetical protein